MKPFLLIETMRVSEGHVYLLDRHLERLGRSAAFFSFKCDVPKIREETMHAALEAEGPACLRLTLSQDGSRRLQGGPLPVGYVRRLKLSSVRVNSDDVLLYHKTSNRGVYDEARRQCDHETDAILVNERGEITETTIANIAVLRDGRWVTPQVSSGLLAGVMREDLLSRDVIVEGVIHASELQDGEIIRCFNALRGVNDIQFTANTA